MRKGETEMILMFQHKRSDGSLDYIGFDTDKGIYSLDYYANVGLFNAGESIHVSSKQVKFLRRRCSEEGFKCVTYLRA